jgi:phage/plasmid-associated DNA primase
MIEANPDSGGRADFGLGDLPERMSPFPLKSSSDEEIANRIIEDMGHDWVYDDGEFYWWRRRYWQIVHLEIFQEYFIAPYNGCPIGNKKRFELNEPKVKAITRTVSRKMSVRDNRFFVGAKAGVNCENGFVQFDEKGDYQIVPHDPNHRQRYLLPGVFVPLGDGGMPHTSLLYRFFWTMFKEDPERELKIRVIQEVMGATIAGYGVKLPQPKAVVFLGPGANNGKSQLMDLLGYTVPPDSCTNVSPHHFSHENKAKGLCTSVRPV